jgi:GTPase
LNAVLGDPIAITSPHPQTTRDRIAGIVTKETRGEATKQLVFYDTPGFHRARHRLGERMNQLAEETASGCDVAVFVTDVDQKVPKVREEDKAVLATIPLFVPTILVVNKVDRLKSKELLFPVLEGYQALRDFKATIPLSAIRAKGVDRLVKEIEELLPEGDLLYEPDDISDKPVRFFVGELIREQVLRRTRQEVPHGVAVTVESFDDGPKLVRIAVTIHVAKDSHKAILIGDKGKMLRAIGASARQRAEALLDRKVHLDVFVRATPNWFDDVAKLADLGYADEGAKKKKKRKRPARGGAANQARDGARVRAKSVESTNNSRRRSPKASSETHQKDQS